MDFWTCNQLYTWLRFGLEFSSLVGLYSSNCPIDCTLGTLHVFTGPSNLLGQILGYFLWLEIFTNHIYQQLNEKKVKQIILGKKMNLNMNWLESGIKK